MRSRINVLHRYINHNVQYEEETVTGAFLFLILKFVKVKITYWPGRHNLHKTGNKDDWKLKYVKCSSNFSKDDKDNLLPGTGGGGGLGGPSGGKWTN